MTKNLLVTVLTLNVLLAITHSSLRAALRLVITTSRFQTLTLATTHQTNIRHDDGDGDIAMVKRWQSKQPWNKIRLPSNLRSTTHECVHIVTRGHFRSRDKDTLLVLLRHTRTVLFCVCKVSLQSFDIMPPKSLLSIIILLPKYYDHLMKCRCHHLHCLAPIFPPAALC